MWADGEEKEQHPQANKRQPVFNSRESLATVPEALHGLLCSDMRSQHF